MFLPSDAMHSAKYVVATCLCVRPSVFPSVTRWYPIEAVILILNLFFTLR